MFSWNHYFFILPSNSLALLGSLSFFNLLWGVMIFFKCSISFPMGASILMIMFFGLAWWINYSHELNLGGLFSFNMEMGIKFSMILFILSEVFFFFSFFWAYFFSSLCPFIEGSFFWPPYLIEMFEFDKLPLVNTFILLSSGVSVTLSHMFMESGKKLLKEFFLAVTISLGVLFSSFQLMEYNESFFSMNDGNFGSVFFILTGFHGLHVLIGSFFLLFTACQSIKSFSRLSNFMSFELASWYWHFVDVIWVFLFYFVYYKNFV